MYSVNDQVVVRFTPPPEAAVKKGGAYFALKQGLQQLEVLVPTAPAHKLPNLTAGSRVYLRSADYQALAKAGPWTDKVFRELVDNVLTEIPFLLVPASQVVLIGF